jgi:hypothetical protein
MKGDQVAFKCGDCREYVVAQYGPNIVPRTKREAVLMAIRWPCKCEDPN